MGWARRRDSGLEGGLVNGTIEYGYGFALPRARGHGDAAEAVAGSTQRCEIPRACQGDRRNDFRQHHLTTDADPSRISTPALEAEIYYYEEIVLVRTNTAT